MIFSLNDFVVQLQDIFPMTIVQTKHGRIAIVQADCDADCVSSLQSDEEYQYDTHELMEKHHSGVNYGWGDTIYTALLDFQAHKDKR